MRAAAILHPYCKDSDLAPFRDPRVNLFRGNELERNDLPGVAIVFGGDGSVHRLLPALAGSDCPLLVVPSGSGNDFAETIGITSVAVAIEAWRKFLDTKSNVREVDLGLVTPIAKPSAAVTPGSGAEPVLRWSYADEEGRFMMPEQKLGSDIMRSQLRHVDEARDSGVYFCCIAGVGLDADANAIANRMPRWLRGNGGYALAAIRALSAHRPNAVTITTDDGERFSGPALLAAFGSAPQYGNGMRMLPKAVMDDGLLDICFVDDVPKRTVVRYFHTIYAGQHLGIPAVHYAQARGLHVDSEHPMPVYADGEYCCDTPVHVRISPKSLRVIVP